MTLDQPCKKPLQKALARCKMPIPAAAQITTIVDDIAESRAAAPLADAGGAEMAAEISESLATAANGVEALHRHADAAEAALARRRALQEEILRRLPPLPPPPAGFDLFASAAVAPPPPAANGPAAPAPAAEAAEKYSDLVMRRFGAALFASPAPTNGADAPAPAEADAAAQAADDRRRPSTERSRGAAEGARGPTSARELGVQAAAPPAGDGDGAQDPEDSHNGDSEPAGGAGKAGGGGGGPQWGGLGNGWGGLPMADPTQVFASFFVLQPAARPGNPAAAAGGGVGAGGGSSGNC
jgi:hypothetical protein